MKAAREENIRKAKALEPGALLDAYIAELDKNEQLRIQAEENSRILHEMSLQFQKIKKERDKLQKEVDELRKQNQHLAGVNKIRSSELFGPSSERTSAIKSRAVGGEDDDDPLSEDGCDEPSSGGHPGGDGPAEACGGKEAPKEPDPPKPTGSKRGGGNREAYLNKLPKQVFFDYDMDALDARYGKGNWRFAHWDKKETIEHMESFDYLKTTYTPVISAGLEHRSERVPHAGSVIPRSRVSASLAASVLADKFSMFSPYYRMAQKRRNCGFPISRQAMSGWHLHISEELFSLVYKDLGARLKKYAFQHCDETPWTIVRDKRGPGKKCFVWLHRSGELLAGYPIVYASFELSRSADHLTSFFSGADGPIYLTCDAYGAYFTLQVHSDGRIIICGCFMHARRRFVDALNIAATGGLTEEQIEGLPEMRAIRLIQEIYLADESLKGLSAGERTEHRKTDVLPKVNAFFDFVKGFDITAPGVSDKMKDAITYAINQEVCLRRFLTDGNIPIDNGAAERSIRPIAQLRRNSLFSCTERGARADMICITLVETAKANGADPYYYLKYLMEKLPQHLYELPERYMDDMMPWSDAYRQYEGQEKLRIINSLVPPASNERPRTPKKKRAAPAAP